MVALSPVNLLCIFLLMFTLSSVYGNTPDEKSFLLEMKRYVGDIYAPSLLVHLAGQKESLKHQDHRKLLRKSHRKLLHESGGDDETLFIVLAPAVIAILSIVFIVVSLIVCFCFKRCSQRTEPPRTLSPIPQVNEITVLNDIGVPLTYEAIVRATDNFSRRNRIGRGGFGHTYRAELAPQKIVAVKKLSASRHQGVPEFDAEVSILSQLHHPNLITLIGYYACQDDRFLIYNYVPGGNLTQFIKARDSRPFNWYILHKIALDIACALSYMHDMVIPHVLHRDIKPSNILLDHEYNAYLSDFGLAKMLRTGGISLITAVAGTDGYIAPEYLSSGRVSNKSDVYSYGLVLMEMMSGRRVSDAFFSLREESFNIASWARSLRDEHRVEDFFTASLWNLGPQNRLEGLLDIAILCTAESASGRPTMLRVTQLLGRLQHLTG